MDLGQKLTVRQNHVEELVDDNAQAEERSADKQSDAHPSQIDLIAFDHFFLAEVILMRIIGLVHQQGTLAVPSFTLDNFGQ